MRAGAWINVFELHNSTPSLLKCCQYLIKRCQSNYSIWAECINVLILQIILYSHHCLLIPYLCWSLHQRV